MASGGRKRDADTTDFARRGCARDSVGGMEKTFDGSLCGRA